MLTPLHPCPQPARAVEHGDQVVIEVPCLKIIEKTQELDQSPWLVRWSKSKKFCTIDQPMLRGSRQPTHHMIHKQHPGHKHGAHGKEI